MATLVSAERLLTFATGWLAVTLLVVGVLIPSAGRLLRRRRPGRSFWRSHYRLGWAAAAVAVLHTVVSITRGGVPLAAEIGLWVASVAALLVGAEIVLGWTLVAARRKRLRRNHLVLTPVIGTLVVLHVILNWQYVVSR
jgi:hypothetical protein